MSDFQKNAIDADVRPQSVAEDQISEANVSHDMWEWDDPNEATPTLTLRSPWILAADAVAPIADADISTKKYVDDTVGAVAAITPAGGELTITGDVNIAGDLFGPSGKVYDTGWINRSDWTNVHLGSDTTLNLDSNVTHSFNAPLSDLLVKVYWSSDGTDANSMEIIYQADAATNYGYGIIVVDNNNIKVQTTTNGIAFITDAGGVDYLTNDNGYYKVKVWCLE